MASFTSPLHLNHIKPLIDDADTRRVMDFLSRRISEVAGKIDKRMAPVKLAEILFTSKKGEEKQIAQEIEKSLRAIFLDKNNPNFDKETQDSIHVFSMFLHRFPGDPMQKGLEYIKSAPGYCSKKGFYVPYNWKKNQIVTLNQIYREQFFIWMLKCSHMPFEVILDMLQLLESFDCPSKQLSKEVWDNLYSQVTEEEQKQHLKEFQSKYKFMQENKFLQTFPIELQKIEVTCNLRLSKQNLYRIWKNSLSWIKSQIKGYLDKTDLKESDIGGLSKTQSLEKQDIYEEASNAVLMHKLKKISPGYRESIKIFIGILCEHKRTEEVKSKEHLELISIKESQDKLQDFLDLCSKIREKKSSSADENEIKNLQALLKIFLETPGATKLAGKDTFYRGLGSSLEELMLNKNGVNFVNNFFENVKDSINKYWVVLARRVYLDELESSSRYFLTILFFLDYIINLITAENVHKKQKIEELSIDQFENLLGDFDFENKCKTPKKQLQKKGIHQSLPKAEAAQEEELTAEDNLTSIIHVDKAKPSSSNLDEVYMYIKSYSKNKQLNGCLSQALEVYLKPIKSHLSRLKQGREVCDHLLLGISALEHMAQAIQDRRNTHVVLGFRSALIHCNFALEQFLCYKILQETGEQIDSHNLIYLAGQLEKCLGNSILEDSKEFLQEITVQLSFRYPEDYRLYFGHHRISPKAFCLLDSLYQVQIKQEDLQEAVRFSFEKYSQTLEFILRFFNNTALSNAEFRSTMNAMQEHLCRAVSALKSEKSINSSLISKKVNVVEKILQSLQDLVHIKDFEEGLLLATFNNIRSYVNLIKIAINTPKTTDEHSLQSFIRIETLLNMDKLFKHLFRAISILRLGEDNHAHDLRKLFPLIDGLLERDQILLTKINIGIAHHYLHRSSTAEMKKEYQDFLEQSCALLSTSQKFSVVSKDRRRQFSHQNLRKIEDRIVNTVGNSLDLLIRLLKPIIRKLEMIHKSIEEELQKSQRIVI